MARSSIVLYCLSSSAAAVASQGDREGRYHLVNYSTSRVKIQLNLKLVWDPDYSCNLVVWLGLELDRGFVADGTQDTSS